MDELEAKYRQQKAIYDQLVAQTHDASGLPAIAAAKKAMKDTVSEMLELSEQTGRTSQQDELIRRIMQIQYEYNELLQGTDHLQTLRLIHQTTDVQHGTEMKGYGIAFLVAAIGLLVFVTRTT